MILNLDYYKGTDNYSDGDIENTIIEYINSGKNVDEILKKDSSWPVFYHLSDIRQNIVNWYPFKKDSTILEIGGGMGAITPYLCSVAKKVVTVESSKRRAKAIELRTKNYNNLEIIVGNFNDIEFDEKFDYITLIGVYEYALMFTKNKNNAYVELLKSVKKLLKPNGKILIAIENRFGLKYWCGAREDHTNIVFDGINNYSSDNNFVRTFSKADLEKIFDNVGLKYNFYYPLPDFKFPELILTDEAVKANKEHSYHPYYSQRFNMFSNETKLFNDILNNNGVDFFANSYFIELSLEEMNKEIEYAKFNNYRSSQYATITYKVGNKYYKRNLFADGSKHIANIIKYYEILKKHNINCVEVIKDGKECYTNNINNRYSLMDSLIDLYSNNKLNKFYLEINKYIEFLNNHFEVINDSDKTIFEKYNVKISKLKRSKLHFIKDGFIDLCFQNFLLDNDEYLLIDQEWYLENVPVEFIIYRSIHLLVFNYLNVNNKVELYSEILKNININLTDYLSEFDKLEDAFIKDIAGDVSDKYGKYYFLGTNIANDISDSIDATIYEYQNMKKENEKMIEEFEQKDKLIAHQGMEIDKMIDVIHNKDDEYKKMEEIIHQLQNENNNLRQELSNIYNSKGYKMLQKFYKIKNK